MKQFLYKIIIYAAASICLFALLFALLPDNPDLYLLQYRRIIDMLEKPYSGSRIIFSGGSFLAFGIDSRLIGKETGIDNVINCGLHAGMGMKYILDDIALYVKPDDILVVAAGFSQFSKTGGGVCGSPDTLCGTVLIGGHKKFALLNIKQMITAVKGLPSVIKEKFSYLIYHIILHKQTSNVYSLSAFNEYGDQQAHWNMPDEQYIRKPDGEWRFNNEFGIYFVKKIRQLRSVCAKVIIIPAITSRTSFENNKNSIETVSAFLQENKIPFQIAPEKCVVPDTYTFDGDSHMNRKGVDFYSALIITMLKDALKRQD